MEFQIKKYYGSLWTGIFDVTRPHNSIFMFLIMPILFNIQTFLVDYFLFLKKIKQKEIKIHLKRVTKIVTKSKYEGSCRFAHFLN
jgi:hypothetical protein